MIAFAWACIAAAAPLPRVDDAAPEPTEATVAPEDTATPPSEGDGADSDAAGPDTAVPDEAPEPAVEPEPPLATPQGRPTFLAGNSLDISDIEGDVFGTARNVTVTGPVADNGYLLGQFVEVKDTIEGDALLMGQKIRVTAPVLGDVYAVGEEIRLDAPVYGNVYAAGNIVGFGSEVHGVVEASAREVELFGQIHKDASLRFASVELGSEARVDGDVSYVAPRTNGGFERITDGDVRFTLGDFDVDLDPSDPLGILQEFLWWMVGVLFNYVGLIATGGVLIAFASPFVREPSKAAAEQPIMSAALGFVAAIVIPVASLVAMLLFVTIPLGVVAFALYGVGLYIVQIFTASAIGHAVNRRFFPGLGKGDFAALATGLVPLVILSGIPKLVGTAVWLLATFVGFGALWVHWRDEARDRRRSRKRD